MKQFMKNGYSPGKRRRASKVAASVLTAVSLVASLVPYPSLTVHAGQMRSISGYLFMESADGEDIPAYNQKVTVRSGESEDSCIVDDVGHFEVTVPANETYELGFDEETCDPIGQETYTLTDMGNKAQDYTEMADFSTVKTVDYGFLIPVLISETGKGNLSLSGDGEYTIYPQGCDEFEAKNAWKRDDFPDSGTPVQGGGSVALPNGRYVVRETKSPAGRTLNYKAAEVLVAGETGFSPLSDDVSDCALEVSAMDSDEEAVNAEAVVTDSDGCTAYQGAMPFSIRLPKGTYSVSFGKSEGLTAPEQVRVELPDASQVKGVYELGEEGDDEGDDEDEGEHYTANFRCSTEEELSFSITDKDGNVLAENVGGSIGAELPEGDYTLTVKDTDGDIVFEKEFHMEAYSDYNETIVLSDAKSYFVELNRYAEDTGDVLEAGYSILAQDGTEAAAGRTGNEESVRLAEGDYTYHETEAPAGYQTAEDVPFHVPGDTSIDVFSDPITATIYLINETDGDPASVRRLAGLEFSITPASGQETDTLELSSLTSGTTLSKIMTGDYLIKCGETETIVTVEEEGNIFYVQIPKAVSASKGTLTVKGVNGTGIEVYDGNSVLVASGTIQGGIFTIELAAGWYAVSQSEVPDGYERHDDIYVSVEASKVSECDMTSGEEDKSNYGYLVFFQQGSDENIIGGCTFIIKDSTGAQVMEFVSSVDGSSLELPAGIYVWEQKSGIDGYVQAAEGRFRIEAGKTASVIVTNQIKEDDDPQPAPVDEEEQHCTYEAQIRLIDRESGNGISGGVFRLENASGKLIETWTTSSQAKKIKDLPDGDYVLKQISAPTGYVSSPSIKWHLEGDGSSDASLFVETEQTSVSFTDIDKSSRKNIEGARVSLIKSGKTVKTWSTGETQEFRKLAPGEYKVEVTSPAKGYAKTETKITVLDKAGRQEFVILHQKTKTKVSVKTKNGKFLKGATIILKKGGAQVKKWKSGTTAKTLTGLEAGTYTISMAKAPSGWRAAADVKLVVGTGSVTYKATLKSTKVSYKIKVLVKDKKGKAVKGAKVGLYTNKGKKITVWTSTSGKKTVKLAPGTYYLKVLSVPKGYATPKKRKIYLKSNGKTGTDFFLSLPVKRR